MVDSDLGLSLVFNGCIYNYADLRARARGLRLPLLLDLGHRGDHQGVSPLGRGLRRALPGDVRLRHRRARQRPPGDGARPAGDQAPLPGARCGLAAVRLDLAGAAGGGRRRHLDRSRGLAPLHVVPLGGSRAAHHPRGRAQAAARHGADRRARRERALDRLLASELRSPRARHVRRRVAGGAARQAAAGRRASHGRRRAHRRAAVGRARLEPHRRAARAERPARA